MNKLKIFLTVLLLALSPLALSPLGMAGVVMVDDAKPPRIVKTEKPRNEISSSPDEYDPKAGYGKDKNAMEEKDDKEDKSAQKKNLNSIPLLGF